MNPRSDTKTIIVAMKYLSEDGIYSEDGVANAAIAEAAQRLEELALENEVILKNQLKTQQDLEWWKGYADKLVAHIPYLPKDMEVLREANLDFANQIQNLEDRLEDTKEEYIHLLQYVKTLREDNERLTKQNESLLVRTSKNDRRIWL
jgi:chromosome segregation ATPase